MLESRGLTTVQFQSMPLAMQPTRVSIWRRREAESGDGNAGALGNPLFYWALIVKGWPCLIAAKHGELLTPDFGNLASVKFKMVCQYKMLSGPRRELIVQEKDVVVDESQRIQYLVTDSHDPGGFRGQIIVDLEQGSVDSDFLSNG